MRKTDMLNHEICIYMYMYMYIFTFPQNLLNMGACFQKNSFLIFFFFFGGGGFKISSYTIVGVHPDIKIQFFLKR